MPNPRESSKPAANLPSEHTSGLPVDIPHPWPQRLGSWLLVPAVTCAGLLAAGSAAHLAGGESARNLQNSGNPDQSPPAQPGQQRDPLALILGGFTPTAANIVWLQAFDASVFEDWSEASHGLIRACRLSPRNLYFWTQAAHQIAYSFPSVLSQRESKRLGRQLTPREHIAFREKAGYRALALLREALAWHPNHPELLHKMAIIHISIAQADEDAIANLETDLAKHPSDPILRNEIERLQSHRRQANEDALPLLKKASEQPGAPYSAARTYAEILRRLNRPREAYEWYRRLHPTLPRDVFSANADVVLERIRELETELLIPPSERYRSK